MAELSIRLVRNRETGQQEIRIGLVSDEDELPQEHEQNHRSMVLRLLSSLTGLEVERERPGIEPAEG